LKIKGNNFGGEDMTEAIEKAFPDINMEYV